MSIALDGMETFAMAYLDDIMVFSRSPEEHFEHLQRVFDRLKRHGLKMKLSKCQFLREETKYLGFVINKDRIKTDVDKVEVIRAMSAPKTVREIKGFIGAIGYYRKFIPAFSRLAGPLISLTKKYVWFRWTEDCHHAFEALKDQLTAVPLLVYPDLSKLMMLYTDASDRCIGAVLTQSSPNKDGPMLGGAWRGTNLFPLSSTFWDPTKMAGDREGGVHHPVHCAEVGLLYECGSIYH